MRRGLPTHSRQGAQNNVTTWHDSEEMLWTMRDWAVRIGVKAPQLRFKAMKDSWGTMSSPGWIMLHPDLLALPKELGELVIVHELLHILIPNHGKVFKCFMEAYMPDWEEREQRLQGYAKKEKERS